MTPPNTTRRALLGRLPAAAAMAVPSSATALALPSEPADDPIFAAIEAYWLTYEAESDAYRPIDEARNNPVPPEVEQRHKVAKEAYEAARDVLVAAVPATVAGCHALVLVEDGLFTATTDWHKDIVANLRTGLERLEALS
jgi:hypothetical protein